MKNEKLLLNVINSMTMNEKRYFKIFCTRHILGNQNKYVLLFDILQSFKTFDEKELKLKLDENEYSSNFISSDLNYLKKILFKSLNEFHSEKTNDLKIKQQLLSIEILFYKGLYEECLELIQKAKKIKLINENTNLLIELINWEIKCQGYSKGLVKAMEINNSKDKYFNDIILYKKITDVYYKSYLLKNSLGRIKMDEIIFAFKELISDEILLCYDDIKSIQIQIYYYLIYSNYYHALRDNENELQHLYQALNFFDENEDYKYENPLDFVSIYIRIIDIKKNSDSESFYQELEKLRKFENIIKIQKNEVKERIFLFTNQIELEHLLIINKFNNALEIMNNIILAIENTAFKIEPYYYMKIYYLFASILCMKGDFSSALKFINKIINNYKFSNRPSIFIRAEFLNIIIHYELKNYELVLYAIENVKKKYKSNYKFNFLEEKILELIKRISFDPSGIKEKLEFKKILAKIDKKYLLDEDLLKSNYYKYIVSKV